MCKYGIVFLTQILEYKNLWGLVKFHIGGTARERILRRTGEIPVPTVKVRMKEDYTKKCVPRELSGDISSSKIYFIFWS